MAIAQISPNSVLPPNSYQVNPQARTDLVVTATQATQATDKVVKAAKTDTVTISPQAVQMASDKDSSVREATENTTDKASEILRGAR
jgi:hypothetical protein